MSLGNEISEKIRHNETIATALWLRAYYGGPQKRSPLGISHKEILCIAKRFRAITLSTMTADEMISKYRIIEKPSWIPISTAGIAYCAIILLHEFLNRYSDHTSAYDHSKEDLTNTIINYSLTKNEDYEKPLSALSTEMFDRSSREGKLLCIIHRTIEILIAIIYEVKANPDSRPHLGQFDPQVTDRDRPIIESCNHKHKDVYGRHAAWEILIRDYLFYDKTINYDKTGFFTAIIMMIMSLSFNSKDASEYLEIFNETK